MTIKPETLERMAKAINIVYEGIDYDELSKQTKDFNRKCVKETLYALLADGYVIVHPDEVTEEMCEALYNEFKLGLSVWLPNGQRAEMQKYIDADDAMKHLIAQAIRAALLAVKEG